MNPDVLIAVVTAVSVLGAAVIAAVPGLLSLMRRTRGAVEAEGAATRDALDRLGAVLNSRVDDVRDDVEGVRASVAFVRDWQASHDAEHYLMIRPPRRDDP